MKKKLSILLVLILVLSLFTPTYGAAKTKKVKLKAGKTVTAYAIKGYQKISLNISGTSYKWKSSNKNVATVSKKGKITLKAKGTSKITAVKKKKTYTLKLVVEAPYFSRSSAAIMKGQTTSSVGVIGTKQAVKYKSTNPAVAKVTSKGRITGVSAGTCYITATIANAVTLKCIVSVRDLPTPTVTPVPATPTPTPTSTPTPTPIPRPTQGASMTTSQANAVNKAKSYLRVSAFSREGLIGQLEYEGFNRADATYGADNAGANWFEQAEKKAKSYLRVSAFSYTGLIKQLEYEKFTKEQAVYGVDRCGADWYEQAVKKAASYLRVSSFSHDRLVGQLEYEGFTTDQAEYGVSQNGL